MGTGSGRLRLLAVGCGCLPWFGRSSRGLTWGGLALRWCGVVWCCCFLAKEWGAREWPEAGRDRS